MDLDERPLVVQLNWTKDNREGRFVLKRDKESSEVTLRAFICSRAASFSPRSNTISHLCFLHVLDNKGKLSREGKRRRDRKLQEDAVEERQEEREEQSG